MPRNASPATFATPRRDVPVRVRYSWRGRGRLGWRAGVHRLVDLIGFAIVLGFSSILVFVTSPVWGLAAASLVAVLLGAWKVHSLLRRFSADRLTLGDS